MIRSILMLTLSAFVFVLAGCPEKEPEVPEVDPCLDIFDLNNPTGNWMWARGASAAPMPDTAYRVHFFKDGDTHKAYYVHDLQRYEMTGIRRELDWLFETGPLTPVEGDPAPKAKVHAYLSLDKVCHVNWTDGYSGPDGVEKSDNLGRKTLAPVGEATIFSYYPCSNPVMAGKANGSFKAAQKILESGEPTLLDGDTATLVSWTDVADVADDCELSFDYFWDGLQRGENLTTVKKGKEHHKWSHHLDVNAIGSHDVTFELYKSCGGAPREVFDASCGLVVSQ